MSAHTKDDLSRMSWAHHAFIAILNVTTLKQHRKARFGTTRTWRGSIHSSKGIQGRYVYKNIFQNKKVLVDHYAH